jgi:hypothetical protein
MANDKEPTGHRAGGGIASKQVRQSMAYKTEPEAQAARPAEVSFLGQALAFEPEGLFGGPAFNGPYAGQAMPCPPGPGGGRTLYGQGGTQGTHGPTAKGEPDRNREAPGSRDILKDYGPES